MRQLRLNACCLSWFPAYRSHADSRFWRAKKLGTCKPILAAHCTRVFLFICRLDLSVCWVVHTAKTVFFFCCFTELTKNTKLWASTGLTDLGAIRSMFVVTHSLFFFLNIRTYHFDHHTKKLQLLQLCTPFWRSIFCRLLMFSFPINRDL